jgi:TPR repeat protein
MHVGGGNSSQCQVTGATSAHGTADPAQSKLEPGQSRPGLGDPNRSQTDLDPLFTNITTTSVTTTTFTASNTEFGRDHAGRGARVPAAPVVKTRDESPEPRPGPSRPVKSRASLPLKSGKHHAPDDDGALDGSAVKGYHTSPGSLWTAEAQFRMGNCIANSRDGVGANAHQARKWWRQAARRDNLEAQLALVSSYQLSTDLPDHLAKAARWLGKAAKSGDTDSMARYGEMLAKGEGIARDDHAALDWFQRAAENGDAGGLFWLGVFHQVGRGGLSADARRAYACYRQAARKKHAQAQFARGYMLWHRLGTERNLPKSVRTYMKAAMQGVPEALWRLGICLEHGICMAKDIPIAVNAFRMAAANQDPDAMFHLARCHYRGIGVEKDRNTAVEWLAASKNYAHLIMRDAGGEIDTAQALRLLDHEVEAYEERLVDMLLASGAAVYRQGTREEEAGHNATADAQGGVETAESQDPSDSPDSNDSPDSADSADSQGSNDSQESTDKGSLSDIQELPEPRSPPSSDSSAADPDQGAAGGEPLDLDDEGAEPPQCYG